MLLSTNVKLSTGIRYRYILQGTGPLLGMGDGLVPKIKTDLLSVGAISTPHFAPDIKIQSAYQFAATRCRSGCHFDPYPFFTVSDDKFIKVTPVQFQYVGKYCKKYPNGFSKLYMHGIYDMGKQDCRKRCMRYEMKCYDFRYSQTYSG